MTKDKERDDAMIAKANENWQAAGVPLPYPDWLAREVLHLERSNWQPAPKPDRAEVLFDKWFQTTSVDTDFAHEDKVSLIAVIRRHFDELRAEWEAERSDEPVCLIGKVDCDGNELVTVSKDALDRYKDQARYTYQRAEKAEARVKELEA